MPKKEINARIASIRKLRGYKQADIAEFLGLKTSTYSQMERNGNITGEMIIKIAKIFDIDPRIILCGEEETETPPPPDPIDPPIGKLKNSEENIIKIIRNLNKEKHEMVFDAISRIAGLGKYKGIKPKRNTKRNA